MTWNCWFKSWIHRAHLGIQEKEVFPEKKTLSIVFCSSNPRSASVLRKERGEFLQEMKFIVLSLCRIKI